MNYFLLSVGTLALLAMGWLGWQLLRQNGRMLLRLDELEKRLDTLEFGEDDQPTGLSLGSDAPAFELSDLAGERKTLAQYRGQPVLLIFFNPACGFCRELAPKLANNAESRKQKAEMDPQLMPQVLIVSTGDLQANRALFAEHNVSCPVLLQKAAAVAATYQVNGTPSGYLVDAEGRIVSPLAMGTDALLKLLEGKVETGKRKVEMQPAARTLAGNGNGDGRADRFRNRSLANSRIRRDGLKAGTVAPEFRLPRLDGRGELSLSELRGRQVLLVFSSPSCGPCTTLAPELEKFHCEHPELEVVMISKGEPRENRAKVKEHGLTFPIVLQQQWEISRRYAMFATPVAYLIDEQGTIIQDIAAGVEPILALMAGVEGRGKAEPLSMHKSQTEVF
jgi:peroxiredoxin